MVSVDLSELSGLLGTLVLFMLQALLFRGHPTPFHIPMLFLLLFCPSRTSCLCLSLLTNLFIFQRPVLTVPLGPGPASRHPSVDRALPNALL